MRDCNIILAMYTLLNTIFLKVINTKTKIQSLVPKLHAFWVKYCY